MSSIEELNRFAQRTSKANRTRVAVLDEAGGENNIYILGYKMPLELGGHLSAEAIASQYVVEE